jgi:hypothetical protein
MNDFIAWKKPVSSCDMESRMLARTLRNWMNEVNQ